MTIFFFFFGWKPSSRTKCANQCNVEYKMQQKDQGYKCDMSKDEGFSFQINVMQQIKIIVRI